MQFFALGRSSGNAHRSADDPWVRGRLSWLSRLIEQSRRGSALASFASLDWM